MYARESMIETSTTMLDEVRYGAIQVPKKESEDSNSHSLNRDVVKISVYDMAKTSSLHRSM